MDFLVMYFATGGSCLRLLWLSQAPQFENQEEHNKPKVEFSIVRSLRTLKWCLFKFPYLGEVPSSLSTQLNTGGLQTHRYTKVQ